MRKNDTQVSLYLLDKESIPVLLVLLMNHNNCSNRIALLAIVHSNFCPISFDGSVVDYRGVNG